MSQLRRHVVTILLIVFVVSTWAPTAGAACDQRCYESTDIRECRAAARGHNNCRITSNCWVEAIDPDGPGGNPPIAYTVCNYDCIVDYCVWI